MSLIIKQAEYYSNEKKQRAFMSTLYRLSHELSKLISIEEVAMHSFSIISEEIQANRYWLGTLNESRTHLIGRAVKGIGARKALGKIRIDLNERHDFIDQVIKTKKAVIVPKNSKMYCSKLNKLVERLSLETIILLPLVSLGQVCLLYTSPSPRD